MDYPVWVLKAAQGKPGKVRPPKTSKIYRFEIPFLTVYLVKNCLRTFQGGAMAAWPPPKYATVPL